MKICNCTLPYINPNACDHCSNNPYKNWTDNLRPPLGVMPKWLCNEKRIQEITRALNEYANFDIPGNKKSMLEWAKELVKLLEEG